MSALRSEGNFAFFRFIASSKVGKKSVRYFHSKKGQHTALLARVGCQPREEDPVEENFQLRQ